MERNRFTHSLTHALLPGLAILSLGLVLAGCDSDEESEPEVQEVVIAGTQVDQDFLTTGEYSVSATPVDVDGNSILSEDVDISGTLSTPSGQSVEAELDITVEVSGSHDPSDDPLAVSVNIDGSGSMSSTDPNDYRIGGARSFVSVVDNRLSDWEIAMFTYAGNPDFQTFFNTELLQDFTDDAGALRTSVDAVQASGGTPTYESLSEIQAYSEDQRSTNSYRKGIVLLSDGQPGSTDLKQQVCQTARTNDEPIYTIGLGPASDISPDADPTAVNEMRSIANCSGTTGNPAVYAGIDPANVQDSAEEIYNAIATTTALGNLTIQVTLTNGNQLGSLSPGTRLNGTLTVNSGGGTANGSYSFTVPDPSFRSSSAIAPADK